VIRPRTSGIDERWRRGFADIPRKLNFALVKISVFVVRVPRSAAQGLENTRKMAKNTRELRNLLALTELLRDLSRETATLRQRTVTPPYESGVLPSTSKKTLAYVPKLFQQRHRAKSTWNFLCAKAKGEPNNERIPFVGHW